jgi:hypothetical protein
MFCQVLLRLTTCFAALCVNVHAFTKNQLLQGLSKRLFDSRINSFLNVFTRSDKYNDPVSER